MLLLQMFGISGINRKKKLAPYIYNWWLFIKGQLEVIFILII